MVLREYHEGASFVQVKSQAGLKASIQGDDSGILGMLEIAEFDFAKGLAEACATVECAADEYKKMMQENKMFKATKRSGHQRETV